MACQSLDNQILIYTADGTFRQVKKKRFAGHTIAGYACNIGFSPDGKYISSGTGAGDVVFWDWKTGKIVKRIRAHDQVVIDHAWLPNEPVSIFVICNDPGEGIFRQSRQAESREMLCFYLHVEQGGCHGRELVGERVL